MLDCGPLQMHAARSLRWRHQASVVNNRRIIMNSRTRLMRWLKITVTVTVLAMVTVAGIHAVPSTSCHADIQTGGGARRQSSRG